MPGHSRVPSHSVVPVDNLLHKAQVLYTQQEWIQGQSLLERAIRLAPDNGDAWHLMAIGYFELGQMDKAQHFARRANDLLSTKSVFWFRNQQLLSESFN